MASDPVQGGGEAPVFATPQIEADDQQTFDDGDSALGSMSALGSTASLASSVLRYREENGRTYHAYKDGQYAIPNDEVENDRLDLQHHLFALTLDGALGLCPLNSKDSKVKRVLDVGTGTGIWAIDFADDHPSAHVIGADLSPIQPSFVPPNCAFEVDDLEEDWTYSQKFDYIHARMMLGSFSNWPKFFKQAFDNLEPGGWLELQDSAYPTRSDDGTQLPDGAVLKWAHFMLEATEKIGKPLNMAPKYAALMQEAGFTNVSVKVMKWPSNGWPKDKKFKEMGVWSRENMLQGIDGFTLGFFTRVLGWTKEEVDILLADVKREIRDTGIHAYWAIYYVYGQKPEVAA